jgi:hypothetical protein
MVGQRRKEARVKKNALYQQINAFDNNEICLRADKQNENRKRS